MPPIGSEGRSHVTQITRPDPPLQAGPSGYLAAYVSSSPSADRLPLSNLVQYEYDYQASGFRVLEPMIELIRRYPDDLSVFFWTAAIDRERSKGRHEDMIRTLEGLSKHSWDLDSYLDGVSRPEIIQVLRQSELRLPIDAGSSSGNFDLDDFVQSLAEWFKKSYMKWVDPIPCPSCGGRTRASPQAVYPTPEESREGGGRAELHLCERQCGGQRRFIRYGAIRPLLRTREGRCGEWAHLFYCFLRVSGVEARYVWNSEDHVWTEFWSSKKRHWVHVDSCEAATDKPLLYAKGWGKKQSFCLAFGPYGAEDVTKAYIDDWPACKWRRKSKGWNERRLRLALSQHTVSLRMQYSKQERQRLAIMDNLQSEWILNEDARLKESEQEAMGGRISGPEEWKKLREELGSDQLQKPSYLDGPLINDMLSSSLYVFGSAQKTANAITLTDRPGQTGGVFADASICTTTSFRMELGFRMTAPSGAGEADGMGVIFSRDRRLGERGFGLGYTGLGGAGDFAVEIDTYRSQDHADDPPTPHISLHSPPHAHHRHSLACTQPGRVPFLSDGKTWTLELFYQATKRELKAFLRFGGDDGSQSIGLWSAIIPEGNNNWYVGVTGSCGGLWQKQEILSWKIYEASYEETEDHKMNTEGL